MNLFTFLALMFLIVSYSEAYKILMVFNFPSRSLSNLGAGIAKHLFNAGHEITYVTPYPLKNQSAKNFRQIDISKSVLHLLDDIVNITSVLDKHSTINTYDIQGLQDLAVTLSEATFQNADFLKMLQDPSEKFDVVIADLYETEVYSGLSLLYKCPMIWSFSMGTQWSVLNIIDEATHPAYTVDYLSSHVPPLTFLQRIEELLTQIKGTYVKQFITKPKERAVYKKVFGPLLAIHGRSLPCYDMVALNASLIFANEYNAKGNIPSIPQNFKLVGGQHIDNPVKPLSQELQTIMDTSKNGVIFFSLGSIWKSKDMPRPLKRDLIRIFGELNQTVLWKYEGQDLKKLPKNLVTLDWAPQTSIMNHPNCLMFITHSGLLSSIEAIHFGVPTIGIPIFFDQKLNAKRAVLNGYSIAIEPSYNLAFDLKQAILQMIQDQRYTLKAKQLSKIYHDRPVSLEDEVVYWVEHVIRTRGAVHLKSPARQLAWYQKMYLDLVVLVLGISAFLKYIIRRVKIIMCPKNNSPLKNKKQ